MSKGNEHKANGVPAVQLSEEEQRKFIFLLNKLQLHTNELRSKGDELRLKGIALEQKKDNDVETAPKDVAKIEQNKDKTAGLAAIAVCVKLDQLLVDFKPNTDTPFDFGTKCRSALANQHLDILDNHDVKNIVKNILMVIGAISIVGLPVVIYAACKSGSFFNPLITPACNAVLTDVDDIKKIGSQPKPSK
jgi:hypothetical protein